MTDNVLSSLHTVWNDYQDICNDEQTHENWREYDKENIKHCFPNYSSAGVDYLYQLIQGDFSTTPISLLYKSNWTSAEALRLAEIVTESLHQSLDGWSDGEKVIIQLYLHDLAKAFHHTTVEDVTS